MSKNQRIQANGRVRDAKVNCNPSVGVEFDPRYMSMLCNDVDAEKICELLANKNLCSTNYITGKLWIIIHKSLSNDGVKAARVVISTIVKEVVPDFNLED